MRSVFPIFSLLIIFFPCQIGCDPRAMCRNDVFTDHIVSIQTDKIHRCNGVILSKKRVMTTALCVTDHLYRVPPDSCDCQKEITIIYDIKLSNLAGLHCAKETKVIRKWIHNKFKREDKWAKYDVAVLEVDCLIEILPTVKPLIFPSAYQPGSTVCPTCDKEAVVVGYWMNIKQKEPSTKITCLDVHITDLRDCQSSKGISFLQNTLMCTHDSSERVGGLCKGHYGAPIFCYRRDKQRVELMGILSHRYGLKNECGSGSPIFYTKIDSVANFLKNPELHS